MVGTEELPGLQYTGFHVKQHGCLYNTLHAYILTILTGSTLFLLKIILLFTDCE
jgi:hypothetical protein